MKLALRKTPPANASMCQRAACRLIQARLVSQYNHGGIVIDGWLYHVTASHGPHKLAPGDWSPELWDISDVGGDDARAVALFETISQPPRGRWRRAIWKATKGYDWFSLLAFVGPFVRVSWLTYCFEWCWLGMTGQVPKQRVTPEMLLTVKRFPP